MLSGGSSASKIKRKIAIRGTIELKLGDDCTVTWVGLIFICMIIMPSIYLLLAPSGAEGGNPIVTVVGSGQDDLFGWNVSSAGDVNGDGFDDIIVGAPGYDNNRGRVHLFFGGPWFTGDLSASNANVTINGGAQGDDFGWDVASAGDINNDSLDDIVFGAPGNSSESGAVYIYLGRLSGIWSSPLTVNDANFTLAGQNPGDKFGSSISSAGDMFNDGYDDVIVGAYGYGADKGRVYVFESNGTSINEIINITGENDNDMFGFSVSCAGDVNNDGRDDFIVGAPGFSSYKGRVYIYYPLYYDDFEDGDISDWTIYSGTWNIEDDNGDKVLNSDTGSSVRYVYNGVNTTDMIVQCRGKAVAGSDSALGLEFRLKPEQPDHYYAQNVLLPGYNKAKAIRRDSVTNVFFSDAWPNSLGQWHTMKTKVKGSEMIFDWDDGAYSKTASDSAWNYGLIGLGDDQAHQHYDDIVQIGIGPYLTGENPGDLFGWSVTGVADYDCQSNGDDVIVGAPGYGAKKGRAYIFYSNGSMTDLDLSGSGSTNVTLVGESTGDQFGYCISWAGNFNNDGYNDIIIGAPKSSGNGSLYVFYGNLSMNPNIPATEANFTVEGEKAVDRFGWSVSCAGNIDNDSAELEEIIVGAPYFDNESKVNVGKAYIYHLSIFQPDIWINGSIDNIYQETPGGAQVNFTYIIAGEKAPWWIVVQNDGDTDDTFDFGITWNMLGGWGWELRENVTWNQINNGDNVTLSPGERRNYTLNISSSVIAVGGQESWVIVNVTSQNNTSAIDSVKAIAKIEKTSPEISNVAAIPKPQRRWGYVNITCNATDNINVYGAWVNITYPNGTWSENMSMTQDFGNQWYYNASWDDVGNYTFTIWVNDTNDNWNSSSGWFKIRPTMHVYFVSSDITIDGLLDEPVWSDPAITVTKTADFFGRNLTIYAFHNLGILYIGVEMQGNTNNNGKDFVNLTFDTQSNGTSTPQPDDKMIQVMDTGGGNNVFYFEGDGATWQPASLPVGWKADSRMLGIIAHFEFAIPILDVWGMVPPEDNATIGFGVHAYDDQNPKTHVWWPDNGYDGEFPKNDYSIRPYSYGTLIYHAISAQEKMVLKELYLQDDGDYSSTDVFDLMNRTTPSDTPLQDYDSDGEPGLWIDNKWDPSKPADTRRYQYWNLTPELASDLHMVGYINLVLWVNVSDTNKDIVVAVEVYDNLTKDGGVNQPFAQTTFKRPVWATTWEKIQIPIPITGGEYTLKAGNKTLLLIYMIEDKAKELYLAYGNSKYPSRLESFTNDTFVDVSWVRSYNTSVETSTFIQGEDIFIMTNVTDPFGSYDISGVNITVYYPDGSVLIEDIAMTLNLTDPSVISLWKLFNYTIPTSMLTQVGTYTVNALGIEGNGVTCNATAYFYVLSYQPDLWLNGSLDDFYQDVPGGGQVNTTYKSPSENATWWIVVQNDGNTVDTFNINITSNMQINWTWELRENITWNKVNDGDIISLPPGELMNCTLNISYPISSVNGGESWVIVTVTSQNDTFKKDAVKAIARAIDITPPEIIDTTSGGPTTGDPFTITATVADNVMLYEVHLYYCFDLYGGGTNGPYNVSMESSYSKNINVPSDALVLHYNISANDTSRNWNETGVTTINVQDDDLPEVMDTTAGSPATGDTFAITGVALDNVDISEVHLYYWFDLYGGGSDGPYNVSVDPAYSKNIDVPVNAVTLHYNISANDTSGNWNETGEIVIAILDDELPKIIDTTSGSPTTGDIFTITATLTDNAQVDSVHLYYWFETTGGPIAPLNMSMNDLGGGNYWYDVNMPSIALVFHYKITANDTSNNWNETGFFSPNVADNDLPVVIDTTAGMPKTGESISIAATVTDNIGVDAVHLYYWFDLYGGGTDGPYNISMDPGYSKVINVPFDAVVLYYNISANDTSNNWNEIGEATLGVQDNDLPLITDTTFGTPTTGESFIITAVVSDNIEIGEVHLYYWFDLYGGGIDGPFNVTMDPDYTKGINVPMDAIGLHYNISANDTSHNWNETEEVTLEVQDNALPWITDTTTSQPTTGEAFIISATAADNIALGEVHLYYWFETISGFSTATNATMNNLSGGDYDLVISIPANGLVLHYNISGNDTSNNWNETGENILDIIDNDSPLINDISAEPSPQGVFGQVNITVNLTDDIGVSAVWINITHPNGSWINVSMIMANGNTWYHNDIYIEPGDRDYIIWVDDTSGNLNSSTIKQFTITPPTVDYIQIRTRPNGAGEVVNTKVYDLGDIDYYYASGYNLSSGYLSEVEVNWVTNNEDSVTFDPPYGSSTTFTAKDAGIGTVFAIFGAIQNQTTFEVVAPQVPEIVGEVPDIDLNEDFSLHNIDLSQYASDPQDSRSALKWFLSGIDNSVITTAGENQTGNHILSFISKENMYANMWVTYWLVDTDGNKASQQAWVNISPVNDPPKIANCPDVFVRFDSPYPFDYAPYIGDIDNVLSELTLTCYDTSHSTVNGFVVTYNYPEDMVGEEVYVTLRVSDGASSDSELIMITITSDYPPVTVDRISDVTLFENETKLSVFDLDEFIMDPDGDSLYMSYGYTHLNITIHSNHTVDISALGEWNGVEKVTFRAEDPIGAIVEQTINVTVIPVNDPPAIKPLPNLKVHHDHNYTFDLYWYISDNDNDIEELTIHTSNPDNVTVCGTQITLNYPKDWEGQQYPYSVPLTVYASDGMETAFRVTTVIVDDDYPPRILYPLDDLVFYEDEYVINIYDLDDYFIDNDSYTIFYTSGNVNIDVTIHENHTVDFFAHPNWFGYEYITIRATDDEGAFVEDTILVTVLPINDAPSIADIPPQIGVKGRVWTLDLVDYISDVDNVLDDLIVSVNGTYVTLVGNVLIFEYPENITEDTIWIAVSDGELETTIPVSVIIEEPPSITPEDVPWLLYLFLGILIAFFGGILLTRIRFFTVEDLLLITRGGILMVHAGRKIEGGKEDRRDKDIVASMFVAVQEFVKDAFANEEGEGLKRMDYGDRKVLIYLGDSLLLAAFISGQESNSLYQKMRDFVEDVEERYEGSYHQGEVLIERLPGVEAMLHSLLEGSYKKGAWKKRKLNTNPLEEKSYQNHQNPPKF